MTKEFKGITNAVKERKKEMENFTKEIEQATGKVGLNPPGERKGNWIAKIEKLKAEYEQHKPTDEEENLCKE